jgi:hypothetical protein
VSVVRLPVTETEPPGFSVRFPVPEAAPPPLRVRLVKLPETEIPPAWDASRLPPTARELAFPPTESWPSSSETFPATETLPPPFVELALLELALLELVVVPRVTPLAVLTVLGAEVAVEVGVEVLVGVDDWVPDVVGAGVLVVVGAEVLVVVGAEALIVLVAEMLRLLVAVGLVVADAEVVVAEAAMFRVT